MDRNKQIELLAAAQAFLSNAIGALVKDQPEPDYSLLCLSFVRKDIGKVEADLKVQTDPAVREGLGLPLVKGGQGREDYHG